MCPLSHNISLSQHLTPNLSVFLPQPPIHYIMASSGILVCARDVDHRRQGVRFVPTTPGHEVENFVGKTLAVRSCHECGIAVIRDSSMDSYDVKVPEATTLPAESPMAKEFKKMLNTLSGNRLDPWGMSPQELGPCTVNGMMQLDSLACYLELGCVCPGCGYTRA